MTFIPVLAKFGLARIPEKYDGFMFRIDTSGPYVSDFWRMSCFVVTVRIPSYYSDPELDCVAHDMPQRSSRFDESKKEVKKVKIVQKIAESILGKEQRDRRFAREGSQSKSRSADSASSLLSNLGSKDSPIIVDEYGSNRGQVRKDLISPIVVTPFGSLPLVTAATKDSRSPLEEANFLLLFCCGMKFA